MMLCYAKPLLAFVRRGGESLHRTNYLNYKARTSEMKIVRLFNDQKIGYMPRSNVLRLKVRRLFASSFLFKMTIFQILDHKCKTRRFGESRLS